MKKSAKFIFILLLLTLILSACTGKSSDKHITFANVGWDSIIFHNAVAGTIAEKAFGYTWEEVTGSTPVMHEAILSGEVDVNMEEWTDNIPSYPIDLEDGKFQELGVNFDDNFQGIYVPRYVIEGDPERGIEASAPDLKYVWDLKDYPEVFPDDDDSDKGRIYGAIPGWEVGEIMHRKYEHYGLDEDYIYFRPGSEAALASALTNAYEKGEPVVGYYWEPTWLMGKYDFVLLEDEPHDKSNYMEGKSAMPSVRVTIGASNEFAKAEENEEIVEFLTNYETSSQLTSEALAYMEETGADYIETAEWFLKENDYLLDEWLDEEEANTIRAYLNEDESLLSKNWIFNFPFVYEVDTAAIDEAVRSFSIKYDGFFGGIRSILGGFVNGVHSILKLIPWFVLILFVILITWRISGKLSTGLLYGALLFGIGVVGFWDHMYTTLSIVIASVIIALVLGFPLGILTSSSELANRILKPILDTMQTMPVFVYLIPAMLFFGLGNAPGVIATTIYSIVPMIRLTSLGIRQIDKEVVEASMSFGSTRLQSLVKVQIPQALPTIMTGVNQTIMMAMAMVVTTSMIGVGGLGEEVLISVNRIEMGRGLISGTSVVIIAVILDRITQGFGKSNEVTIDE